MVEYKIYQYGWSINRECESCHVKHYEPRWLVRPASDDTTFFLKGWCVDCMRKRGLLW